MTRQMKDSGVEWIGEIPEKWNAKKFKYIFSIIGGNGFPENLQGNCKGDYPFFKCSDINGTEREVLLAKNFVNSNIVDKYKFNIIPSDSILMAKIGEALKKNHRKINKKPCIVDNNMQALVFKSYECLMYYHYLSTILDMMWFDNGGTIPSVNNVKLKNFLLPNPPLSEQKKIADYLDAKCAKIDAFIAKQKTVIEKLKEYKQSVITEAVTKGLNPAAPMKTSGVEWIGEIPEDWNINKIKRFLRYVSTKDKGNCEVLSLYRELGIVPKNSRNDNHNVTAEDTSNYRFVRKGDFVINKMKAWQGSVAVSDFDGIVSPAYFVYEFISNVFVKKYFHYLLRNKQYAKEFERLSGGIRIGQWDLPAIEFENTVCLVPSLPEQKEIADYLDKKCAEIDTLIEKKQKFLTELATYKKSMIYEYVTGKKEVA